MSLSSLVIPVLLAGVAVCGLGHRADVYGALTHGAEEGLTVLLRVVPRWWDFSPLSACSGPPALWTISPASALRSWNGWAFRPRPPR